MQHDALMQQPTRQAACMVSANPSSSMHGPANPSSSMHGLCQPVKQHAWSLPQEMTASCLQKKFMSVQANEHRQYDL